MAERSSHDLPNTKSGRQKGLRDLEKKLQQHLESDLLRLLQNSSYCDLELVVDSESLFSHSCIVKTRAARFYTFITTECCVTQTSVVTTIYIENASVVYIRKFIENIYSSSFLPEAENYVLKYLQNTRTRQRGKTLHKSNPKLLSPDTEAFFTPKCSPSELYKPFTLLTTSQEEINLSRSKNNASVLSYYRIVSVEDFQSDLEKELAEQDELFQSLKVISSKKKTPTKPITLPLSRGRTPCRETKEPIKRLPHWRPKLYEETPHRGAFIFQKSLPRHPPGLSSPEMDLSSTTPDSGLDLSSTAPTTTDTTFETKDVNHLDDEDVARLDAMEKNMKACEMFLAMEKQAASSCADEKVKTEPESGAPSMTTPPSSPKIDEAKTSGNFFIDASSLLDDDEISSPPMSLPAEKIDSKLEDSSLDPILERRQGEMVFRNAIPHFSRHEIDVPSCDEAMYSRSLPDTFVKDFTEDGVKNNVPAKAIDIPMRKISAECMPIVSGGASPKDFAIASHTSSPHLPRRHELVPIISGGMDLVEETKPEKKHVPTGEVWVVDISTPKRLLRGTSSESESDNSKDRSSPKPKTEAFPVEKSASLGYFIDFGPAESEPVTKAKKHRNDSTNLKKNMFSMFIDMKDEDSKTDSGAGSLTPKVAQEGADSDGSGSGSGSSKATGKKPLYMFIEAESPGVKRRFSPSVSKLSIKKPNDDDHDLTGDDVSLTSTELNSGQTSLEADVWKQTQETWSNCNDIRITYKQKPCELNEVMVKKDTTFIIDERNRNKSGMSDLHTVIEATPPKSPKAEEGDSGVIATEESDDSFVRLSDMDNASKNPYMDAAKRKPDAQAKYLETGKRKQTSRLPQNIPRMTQSIPEATWQKQQRKPSRIPEKIMSRSTGVVSSAGPRVSKSLSRLFPNLSASTLSLARTHTSDVSEPSSMMSSMDPGGLEISTSETDVSCHGDGAARLGQDLLRMFLDEISPDVVVEVGGRRMKAHKCILSSRCQYFAAMLSGGWVESAGNVISLQGIKLIFTIEVINIVIGHDSWPSQEVPYNFDPECFKSPEDRDIFANLRTKFIPLTCLAFRQKRDGGKAMQAIDDVDEEKGHSCENDEAEEIHGVFNWEVNDYDVIESDARSAQAKLMASLMDTTVDPCDDFYKYSCGNWEKLNPIPRDKAAFGTFEMLRENLDTVLKELLSESFDDDESAVIKAKLLYQSCVNDRLLHKRGARPLLVILDRLGGWPVLGNAAYSLRKDWIDIVGFLRVLNNDILISEWVGPDIMNSEENVIQVDQTSLGLPSRDYFLKDENRLYLNAYKRYIVDVAVLLGAPAAHAKAEMEKIVKFEVALAQLMASPEDRRNISELYRRMPLADLAETFPKIDWVRYFRIVFGRDLPSAQPIVLFAAEYFDNLVDLLDRTHPRIVHSYLLWRFIRHRVNNLDEGFQTAKQRFYKVLFGREEAPPRWKNCVAQVNTQMGMALGVMFVRKYFDEKSKNDTLDMTMDIMSAFKRLLVSNDWIDSDTKLLAVAKLDAMLLRIGYPDFILNATALNQRYIGVKVSSTRYFENTLNILRDIVRTEHNRLNEKFDKTLWNTPPAVVNAYYSRNRNQIMFPAGILQPPFYHRDFPRSLNFGGIGVVIGHEITHGFDDIGRLFDSEGNLNRWWSDQAIEAFHKRAQCLIDQYSRYTVPEVAIQIDGLNTQGENIADNGGIKQAFLAYEKWLQDNDAEAETLPGIPLTHEQLFFLNFAQIWCGTMRPAATRNKLKTAVHSPGRFRVIGTLANSAEFSKVFRCPAGSAMNPVKKCSVWFSYSAVHFALCHIYSGESSIPDSLNIVELATLADMLCLEGLKEVISYTLRVKYCHSFHPPCSACCVGVLDCLPVAADYGLDDLYRKCLRWITKFFVKVWPTKAFANLRKELMEKSLQYHVVHMSVDNVLDTLLSIDKIRGSLPSIRWAEIVTKVLNKLQDTAVKFLADHYSSILTSDQFLALGKDAEWSIERLEKCLIQATMKLPPEQACWSHARLHSILSLATSPDPPDEMQWNESFIILLSTLSEYVQTSLIKQAPRAARSKAWQQMEPELRNVIQEAACLVLPRENTSASRKNIPKAQSSSNVPNTMIRSTARAADLRQVKLAMSQQANKTSNANRKTYNPEPRYEPKAIPVTVSVRRNEVRKSQSTSAVREAQRPKNPQPRFAEVKSRYLQPRSPHKSIPENGPTNARRNMNAAASSSDSSRNCSPAMARAATAKNLKPSRKPLVNQSGTRPGSTRPLSQLAADDNMSTDSLATESSCGDRERKHRGKENSVNDHSTPSLPRKTQSLSSFPNTGKSLPKPKTMIPRMDYDKKTAIRRTVVVRTNDTRSPQLSAKLPQKAKAYANAVNGNVNTKTVDSENNATGFKPPAFVSRSGTFLKDEPTVLKKPDNV